MFKKGIIPLLIAVLLAAFPLIGFAAVTIGSETADFSGPGLPVGWTSEGGVTASGGALSLEGSGNCNAEFALPAELAFGSGTPESEAVFEMEYSTGQTADWTTGCKDKEVNFIDGAGTVVLSYRYNPDGWLRCYWAGGTDVDVRDSQGSLSTTPNEAYRWRVSFNLQHSTFSIQIKGEADADFYTPSYWDSAAGTAVPYEDIPLSPAAEISKVKIWFYGNGEGYTNSVRVADFSYPVLRTEDTEAPYWPNGAAVRADSVSSGSVTLGWDAAADDTAVAKYQIYCGNRYVGQTEGLSYTVTGLEPEAEYEFSVEAADGGGNVSERLSVRASTTAKTAYLLGIEDFETTAAGALPESWLEGQPVAEEQDGNRAMKVGYGGTSKYKLPSRITEGSVSMYFDIKIDDPADVKWVTVYDSNSVQVAQVGVVPDDANNMGLYCYYYSDGWQWGNFLQTQPDSQTSMASVRLGEWITVRLDIDLDAKTYAILYQDAAGTLQPTYRMNMKDTFMTTDPAAGSLSTVEFNASMSTAGYLLDNFRYPLLPGDDKTPPAWIRPNVTEGSIKGGDFAWIDWTDALCSDNVGVAGYQIYNSGQLTASAERDQTSVQVTGLKSETQYTFEVRAVDQNGNQSKNNPTVTLKTGAVSVRAIRTPERLITGEQTAAVTVQNHSAQDQSVTVIAAVYEGSRMTDLKAVTEIAAPGQTKEISITSSVGTVGPDTRMRIFTIDRFGSMTLLNEPVEVV